MSVLQVTRYNNLEVIIIQQTDDKIPKTFKINQIRMKLERIS